jgi:hypothetical protein
VNHGGHEEHGEKESVLPPLFFPVFLVSPVVVFMIALEQALYLRPDGREPRLIARSPRFDSAWAMESEAIILGFGDRPRGSMRCPLTVFAQPLTDKLVAIVRVKDDGPETFPTGLRFHFLVVETKIYEAWIRDPFILAAKVEPAWDATELPTLTLEPESFSPRTVAEVQGVLKRIKPAALRKGENPNSPHFERTIANSESPALLGGAQILVDGGRLIFERPEGDLALASGLWLLLPEATRTRLWPTSFAFARDLEFDLLVMPHVDETIGDGYTTEEQAADYPAGAYELALQRAAEAGDQKDLDEVFRRRDGRQTLKLALIILALLSLVVLASRWLDFGVAPGLTTQQQKAATAAGVVAVGEPWTALGMLVHGNAIWKKE